MPVSAHGVPPVVKAVPSALQVVAISLLHKGWFGVQILEGPQALVTLSHGWLGGHV